MAQVDLKLSKEELESVLLPSIKANFPNLTKIDLSVTEDRQVLVKFDLPIHQVKSLSETFPKEDKILEMRSEGKNVREISKTVGENLKTIKEVLASKPDTRVVERQDFEKMLAAIDSEATKRFQAGEDPNKIAADIAEKHPNERTGAIVDRLHKLFRRLEKDETPKRPVGRPPIRAKLDGVKCPKCGSDDIYLNGKSKQGETRIRCRKCGQQPVIHEKKTLADDLDTRIKELYPNATIPEMIKILDSEGFVVDAKDISRRMKAIQLKEIAQKAGKSIEEKLPDRGRDWKQDDDLKTDMDLSSRHDLEDFGSQGLEEEGVDLTE